MIIKSGEANFASLTAFMDSLVHLRHIEEIEMHELSKIKADIENTYSKITLSGIKLPNDDAFNMNLFTNKLHEYQTKRIPQYKSLMECKLSWAKEELAKEVEGIEGECEKVAASLCALYQDAESFQKSSSVVGELHGKWKTNFDLLCKRKEECLKFQELLMAPESSPLPNFQRLQCIIESKLDIFTFASKLHELSRGLHTCAVSKIDLTPLEMLFANDMPHLFEESEFGIALQNEVHAWKNLKLPVLRLLATPNLKSRHWDIIRVELAAKVHDLSTATIGLLEECNIYQKLEFIESVLKSAQNESLLAKEVALIEKKWEQVKLPIVGNVVDFEASSKLSGELDLDILILNGHETDAGYDVKHVVDDCKGKLANANLILNGLVSMAERATDSQQENTILIFGELVKRIELSDGLLLTWYSNIPRIKKMLGISV